MSLFPVSSLSLYKMLIICSMFFLALPTEKCFIIYKIFLMRESLKDRQRSVVTLSMTNMTVESLDRGILWSSYLRNFLSSVLSMLVWLVCSSFKQFILVPLSYSFNFFILYRKHNLFLLKIVQIHRETKFSTDWKDVCQLFLSLS